MRAGQAGLTGSEGQVAVEQQFVRFNWGVARNPTEHDLGTDLWLMARDVRRFDLGALVGAQVKSGESWFGRPELDEDGAITGWWFYDADDKHFKYWVEHNVPRILVLHDLDTGTSYWVHITSDRVVSTGKGSKILIPNTNVLDADHLDALMQVALGDREPAPWEGSAWLGSPAILGPDRIRYALMAPRLIAPHPNLAVSAYEPEEAVAVLMKMRLTELRPSKPRYFETNAPDHAACRDSDDWRWRFYAALYESVVDGGDVNALHELALHKAASPAQHAAAACVLAAILIEAHMPDEAMAVVDEELKADECGPIDHAWLSMHRARCLAELGHIEEAVAQAIQVQSLRRTHPGDPTAMAVVGAAADLVFTLSGWGEKPIADAVTGRDTLAAWWRTQEVAWGLQFKANEDFKEWAQDTTVSWGKSDRAWLHLRAASLISGVTGDHRAWQAAASQLAQRILTTADGDVRAVKPAVTMMRFAGDNKSISLAARHLLRTGPVEAVRFAASAVDLRRATRTTLHADIELVRRVADVLTVDEADRHSQWALEVLANPTPLAQRLSPSFSIRDIVLDMLAPVVPALSEDGLRRVIEHITTLPPQEDQSIAHGYAKVVRQIPQSAWKEGDLESLREREADNWELKEQFDIVLAAADDSLRSSLQERIAAGSLSALDAFGDVRDLESNAVVPLVAKLADNIAKEISRLNSGQSGRGIRSFAGTLIVLNVWHPEQADWSPVVSLLKTTRGLPHHLQQPLTNLYRLGNRVPTEVVDQLEPVLRSIMTTVPPGVELIGDPDVRGPAAAALETLRPYAVGATDLWSLMAGDTQQRISAAQVVARRTQDKQLDVLAALARDNDPVVRGAVANLLVEWISNGVEVDLAGVLLDRLLRDEGTVVARNVAVRLDGTSRTDEGDRIAEKLKTHPSAFVRRRVAEFLSGEDPAP